MSYMVIHLDNSNEVDYPIENFGELYSELQKSSGEDDYVALTHESDWSLSAYSSGKIILENNLEMEKLPFHMKNVNENKVIELWVMLSKGEISEVLKDDWIEGD